MRMRAYLLGQDLNVPVSVISVVRAKGAGLNTISAPSAGGAKVWLAGLAAWLAGWLGSLAGWRAGLAQGTAGRCSFPGRSLLKNELIAFLVCASAACLRAQSRLLGAVAHGHFQAISPSERQAQALDRQAGGQLLPPH